MRGGRRVEKMSEEKMVNQKWGIIKQLIGPWEMGGGSRIRQWEVSIFGLSEETLQSVSNITSSCFRDLKLGI